MHLFAAEATTGDALDLGDLADDWQEMLKVGRESEPVPWHGLAHLAGLLRFLAAKTAP